MVLLFSADSRDDGRDDRGSSPAAILPPTSIILSRNARLLEVIYCSVSYICFINCIIVSNCDFT